MVNDAYLWIIPYSQHCFLWNFMFYSRTAYLAHQYKKMLYHPYSFRFTMAENPIPWLLICVLNYFCLLLTKVLFETSFKLFQYNTEGRCLSNYSIKQNLCSHYRSRCKGLCQNKKHEFDQYTKGGHFCAAHIALSHWLEIRINKIISKQETAKDGMAGLQSKFQNFNTKVNQMWTTDRQTDAHHQSVNLNCFAIKPNLDDRQMDWQTDIINP